MGNGWVLSRNITEIGGMLEVNISQVVEHDLRFSEKIEKEWLKFGKHRTIDTFSIRNNETVCAKLHHLYLLNMAFLLKKKGRKIYVSGEANFDSFVRESSVDSYVVFVMGEQEYKNMLKLLARNRRILSVPESISES